MTPCCCCSGDLVPLDGAGDGNEDADGEGEVAGALQHLVHRPGVHHLHTNMGKNQLEKLEAAKAA